MIITIEDYQGSSMLRILYIVVLNIIISGCASITIEKHPMPLLYPWDGQIDLAIYNPDKSGIYDNIVDNDVELDISLSDYNTEYRGLKVLGVEVVREPDAMNTRDYIVLKLGIRNISDGKVLEFKPGSLVFTTERVNDEIVKKLSPKAIYQQDSALFCSFDYDLKSWGGKSREISGGEVVTIENNDKNFYECFNVIYDTYFNNEQQKGYLDFTDTLLLLNNYRVYFHPKKIRWMQSN